MRGAPRAVVLPLLGVATLLGAWWLVTALLPATSVLARFAPGSAFQALVHLIGSGEVAPHIVASLRHIVVGLTLAMLLGVPIGLAVGGIRTVAGLTGVVFQFLRMVSPLAWAPLAIMVFGVGDAPVYFLVTMGAVWPIILSVAEGVHALDRRWLLLSRSLGANVTRRFGQLSGRASAPTC
jgi:NitT/TauT family transport system permease protein